MNPVIVIPSYWATTDSPDVVGEVGAYDHTTPIAKPVAELETCLASLDKVRGVLRTVVLLVADADCEAAARARVDGICRAHQDLNPLVVGSREAATIRAAVERIAPRMQGDPVSLRGYGAIRNLGLAVAAVLGHDVVVFLDDDEVALDENFLLDAVYGLGMSNRQGIPILVKSGYFLDKEDSPYADDRKPRWYDRQWSKRAEFNQWMHRALTGTRISRSNHVCGGCFAVSAQAFSQVGFDATITRGEDLDYLFDLRMYGIDVWFDNQWRVRHLPPEIPGSASRFLQNVYRWYYERAKLTASRSVIGLHQVTERSLRPYPAPWISEELDERVRNTAFRRALCCHEHLSYLKIAFGGSKQAAAWAQRECRGYFIFQTYWPRIIATLWDNEALATYLVSEGEPRVVARPKAASSQGEVQVKPASYDGRPAAPETSGK